MWDHNADISAAGVSIMALGALSQNIDLKVIPVDLTYFHAHKSRSRAVVEIGHAVNISAELVRSYLDGKRRESVGELLGSIYQALAAVTMRAPDFDTLKVANFDFHALV
jgi:glycerol-3-phosphate O-acyltransferase / dihydroxyacetone phosphate acyltransferase